MAFLEAQLAEEIVRRKQLKRTDSYPLVVPIGPGDPHSHQGERDGRTSGSGGVFH